MLSTGAVARVKFWVAERLLVEMARDAFECAAIEVIGLGSGEAECSGGLQVCGPIRIVVEAVDHQKIDEFLAPFPFK